MFQYEKALQYPVKIARPNARLAKAIISQLGGPDGELGASMRYLNQRYTMPMRELQGILTDIGTEEPVHRCCLPEYFKLYSLSITILYKGQYVKNSYSLGNCFVCIL